MTAENLEPDDWDDQSKVFRCMTPDEATTDEELRAMEAAGEIATCGGAPIMGVEAYEADGGWDDDRELVRGEDRAV